MSALENAKKLSNEQVLEKIAALDIQEYGLCAQKLSERLEAAVAESKEEGKESGIVCALNNADIDGVLLELLKAEPENVMEGIAIAAYAIETENKILYVPEYAAELIESEAVKTAAEKYGVKLAADLVDVRANEGCALVHIVTVTNLAEAFSEPADSYEAGSYVSINGTALKKVACNTEIAELTDLNSAKALQIGYEYYTAEEAEELTVASAENGVIRVLSEKDCIVTETEKRLTASRKQSCGKCVFCREGLLQLRSEEHTSELQSR